MTFLRTLIFILSVSNLTAFSAETFPLKGEFRGQEIPGFGYDSQARAFSKTNMSFLDPNEWFAEEGIPFWKQMPAGGIYAGVGTERLLMAFAHSKAFYLLCTDRDPLVVGYMRLTKDLLKLAKNKEHFYKLRTDVDFLIETLCTMDLTSRSSVDYDFMLMSATSPLWRKVVEEGKIKWFWKKEKKLANGTIIPYSRSRIRYWESDKLFTKLKYAALESRIQAVQINLGSASDLAILGEALRASSLKISAFDLSNAHLKHYINKSQMGTLAETLNPHLASGSLYLGTWLPLWFPGYGTKALKEELRMDQFGGSLEYFAFHTKNFTSEVFYEGSAFLKAILRIPYYRTSEELSDEKEKKRKKELFLASRPRRPYESVITTKAPLYKIIIDTPPVNIIEPINYISTIKKTIE